MTLTVTLTTTMITINVV